jgi:adenosine 3'-phospho 5'-phosphosulfate transporter B2
LNKKSYPLLDYGEAIAISFFVAIFTFSEKHAGNHTDREDSLYGVSLLAAYLLSDAFTSQWQSRVFKTYNIDQYQMMLGVNTWSIFLTAISLIYSGEGLESMAFLMADSNAFFHMILLSICSATGQLFIFYTIKEFGAVLFNFMMTTRQVLSLLISCIMFSHDLNLIGYIGAFAVFAIVFNRMRRKND